MLTVAEPIPRSAVPIGVDPGLRPALAAKAAGRTIAISYFSSLICRNVLIGDIEVDWLEDGISGDVQMPAGFVALAPIDGVAVVVDERLLEILSKAGPTLVESGLPFARGLSVRLDDGAAWLEFLDSPGARRRAPIA